MNIRTVEAEFLADVGRADATRSKVAYRSYVNEPKQQPGSGWKGS